MTTTPVPSTPNTPNAQAPVGAPPASSPSAGLHLPSYLLGLTTALILLGAAFFFWPRPQPAALQLQAPPTIAPPTAPSPTTAPMAAAPPAAQAQAPTPSPLVVFVSGAVAQPGLYTLAPTARIGDAITAAGGLLPGVDHALINQAQPLVDGAQLHIPAPTTVPATAPAPVAVEPPIAVQAETQVAAEPAVVAAPPPTIPPTAAPTAVPTAAQPPAGLSVPQPLALPTPTAAPVAAPVAAPAERAVTVELPAELPTTGSLINVNTATGPELESLPGIGPAKAQAIIANRPYATVDELDRVPGIGPATLEQIRPLVTTE
jgi:competence protein ComEA